MLTENLSTLQIHKLTKAQYERELAAGNIDANALYLTPDEELDLSGYATTEDLASKADADHTHSEYASAADVDSLESAVAGKLDTSTAASTYETKTNATTKLNEAKTYTDNKVASKANQSDLDSLKTTVNAKADTSALSNYYTKVQIDALELITVEDIDEICGTTIVDATSSEVTF